MEKSTPCCERLLEETVEREVFADMDDFALVNDSSRYALSLRFQFPKFSKGFHPTFFEEFVEEHVGDENLVAIGRLNFPNEWQMELRSKEIREKLIRWGKAKIRNRSCWIYPLGTSEIRGFIHWLPNTVPNQKLKDFLGRFGEVLFVENQKQSLWNGKVVSDSRYYALYLRAGQSMDDLPHFYTFDDFLSLITVRGRNPACFHCKEIGHRKNECKKFKDKLNSYCQRPAHSAAPRRKPRGRRYKASISDGDKIEKGQDTSDLITNKLSNVKLDSDKVITTSDASANKKIAGKRNMKPSAKAADAEKKYEEKESKELGTAIKIEDKKAETENKNEKMDTERNVKNKNIEMENNKFVIKRETETDSKKDDGNKKAGIDQEEKPSKKDDGNKKAGIDQEEKPSEKDDGNKKAGINQEEEPSKKDDGNKNAGINQEEEPSKKDDGNKNAGINQEEEPSKIVDGNKKAEINPQAESNKKDGGNKAGINHEKEEPKKENIVKEREILMENETGQVDTVSTLQADNLPSETTAPAIEGAKKKKRKNKKNKKRSTK
ncbi:CCHC-type domain-containing protein [Trichonephila clavata]|uniref:CCHC-type domain-containing protein n=1 Tax=Trichonephila clavata TaxID=2740835 RepID=A0A8X6H7A7_TRICU|nr:CCHC-type domain-containing protein [Trichonephila clavata]